MPTVWELLGITTSNMVLTETSIRRVVGPPLGAALLLWFGLFAWFGLGKRQAATRAADCLPRPTPRLGLGPARAVQHLLAGGSVSTRTAPTVANSPTRCPYCHECQPHPSTACCAWG